MKTTGAFFFLNLSSRMRSRARRKKKQKTKTQSQNIKNIHLIYHYKKNEATVDHYRYRTRRGYLNMYFKNSHSQTASSRVDLVLLQPLWTLYQYHYISKVGVDLN
jgi:hypothetical protein